MSDAVLLPLVLAVLPAVAPPAPEATRLTVARAVALAVENAPEVAIARAEAAAASSAVTEASSPRRLQAYLLTTPGYSTGIPLSVAGEVPAAVGARVRMTLYNPFGRGDELAASADSAAAEGTLAAARVDAARRAAAACARLSADEARVSAASRGLEAREAIASRVRALGREGRATDVDVERAALEAARARQRLFAAESDRDLDRYELARLAGLPAGAIPAVVDDPSDAIPDPEAGDTAARAVVRDPRLRALFEESQDLSRSARLLAQTFKPSVDAEARYAFVPRGFGYDKYYLNFQENVASIGVSVVLPVLTGGRETAQAARARARVEQVEAERRLREDELAREAHEADARLERSRLEAGLARRAVALGDAGLTQARALAREGRGDADAVERGLLELSDAEEKLAVARREESEARLAVHVLRGHLLEALGVEPAADSR